MLSPTQNMDSSTIIPDRCVDYTGGADSSPMRCEVQEKEANTDQPSNPPVVQCQSHKNMVCDLFCDTCNMDICTMCTIVGDHEDHNTRSKHKNSE